VNANSNKSLKEARYMGTTGGYGSFGGFRTLLLFILLVIIFFWFVGGFGYGYGYGSY